VLLSSAASGGLSRLQRVFGFERGITDQNVHCGGSGNPATRIFGQWPSPFVRGVPRRRSEHLLILVMGAIACLGKRTVTGCLRITGPADAGNFSLYHSFLVELDGTRLLWQHSLFRSLSPASCQILLLFGVNDTIQRRWGPRIVALGIYRDTVRSSHGHFGKASGLRWLSFVNLSSVPCENCVKAPPVLTLLYPSERYDRWGKSTNCRRIRLERVSQLCRWIPRRDIIFCETVVLQFIPCLRLSLAKLPSSRACASMLTNMLRQISDTNTHLEGPGKKGICPN
jgi:hypothetical protein